MKGTRHSEEQIIAILKQGEAGLTTAELCRQHGITEQTYYRWKAKYGGMESGDAKKMKQLEDENRKLKHVVADLTLDNRALKDVLSKNWYGNGTSRSASASPVERALTRSAARYTKPENAGSSTPARYRNGSPAAHHARR
jgi:putative transposase